MQTALVRTACLKLRLELRPRKLMERLCSPVEEDMLWDDEIEEAEYYDKGTRTMRDATGNIVTKHNATVNGRRNRQKMETDFPIGFARYEGA